MFSDNTSFTFLIAVNEIDDGLINMDDFQDWVSSRMQMIDNCLYEVDADGNAQGEPIWCFGDSGGDSGGLGGSNSENTFQGTWSYFPDGNGNCTRTRTFLIVFNNATYSITDYESDVPCPGYIYNNDNNTNGENPDDPHFNDGPTPVSGGGSTTNTNNNPNNVSTVATIPFVPYVQQIAQCFGPVDETSELGQLLYEFFNSASYHQEKAVAVIMENSCSEETREMAIEQIKCIIIENQIISINLDPCSDAILTKLKKLTQDDISKIINRFGDVESIYEWEIETGTPTNPNNVFETNWKQGLSGTPIPYNYTTIVNSSFVNQATDLALARVILHEAIHAYILSYVDDVINDPNAYGNLQNNFPLVWNYYVAANNGVAIGDIEDAHHEQMASTFINVISEALAEYDDNQQDDLYYERLAWGALFNTDAWFRAQDIGGYINLAEAEAITIANHQEDTNGPAANGSPCP